MGWAVLVRVVVGWVVSDRVVSDRGVSDRVAVGWVVSVSDWVVSDRVVGWVVSVEGRECGARTGDCPVRSSQRVGLDF